MQITNICRDVQEDWERGRLHCRLRSYLNEAGIELPGDGARASSLRRIGNACARTIERLLALADSYYRSADAGSPARPGRAAWAIRSARLIYAAIGTELRRRGTIVFAGEPLYRSGRSFA